MSCDEQRNRMQDKKANWDNAKADLESARNAGYVADAAFTIACISAVLSVGGTGPICAAAITALATALALFDNALTKEEVASDAYTTAKSEYDACMSNLRSAAQ